MSRSPELSPGSAPAPEPERVTEHVSERATVVTERRTVPHEARLSGRRWRRTSRWLGLVIFLFGAALLGYVFLEAIGGFQRFAAEDYLANQISRLQTRDTATLIVSVIMTFGSEILRVMYLLLLGYLASAISAKGIQFFAASEAVIDEAVTADIDEEIAD